MSGFDSLGADDNVGFDTGGLLQAAGGLATYGVSAYETDKKEKEGSEADKKKLAAAIAADAAAANAAAKADVSAQLKSASASIDATAAQMASAAQDAAGVAGLSTDAAKKRADAADAALANAVKQSQAKPTDGYLKALVTAWKASANKAHSTAIASGDSGGSKGSGSGGESWLTRKVAGPIPGYGVLVLGAGGLTVIGLLLKKFVFKAAA